MSILFIEQILSELVYELKIDSNYHLVEFNSYLILKNNAGEHLMMIMVTDNEFWLYVWCNSVSPNVINSTIPGYVLDRRIGIDCPNLIDEIHKTINQCIERKLTIVKQHVQYI